MFSYSAIILAGVVMGLLAAELWWVCEGRRRHRAAKASSDAAKVYTTCVDEDAIFWDKKTSLESVGAWFRTDEGLLVRLILAEPPYGEFVDQRGLVGSLQLSRLRRLSRMRPGEWWTFVDCPRHPSTHGFGSLPFMLSKKDRGDGPWTDGAVERVACGCAVPDESAHPQG